MWRSEDTRRMAGAVEVEQVAVAKASCCGAHTGPGYASPLDAMTGPQEALIYVTCVYNGEKIALLILFCMYNYA